MMPRKLTKQECYDLYGIDMDKVVKRDDVDYSPVRIRKVDKPPFGFGRPAPTAKMFKDIIKADELRGPRDEDDSAKVEAKLRAWAKMMVEVDPGNRTRC